MKEKFKLLVNKFREFNRDTYGMLITVSWILLVICLVIKLFGGNWFELWWDNEKFIAVCNYVEKNTILRMTISCINFLMTGYISLCVILNLKKLNLKHIVIFFPIMIFKSIIAWYNFTIGFIIDLIILLVLTTIFNKNFKRSLICFIFINAFMIITLLIRNMPFGLGRFNFGNTVVENALIQVDYYLMLILFYLYNTKKIKKGENK